MINSVGLANPGVERVATVELPWLAEHLSRARVIVNVVGAVPEDYVAVVRRLSGLKVITAFELNVSCPNTERGGEEFGANRQVLASLVRGCRDATDEVSAAAGADGLSVVNTIPGILYHWNASEGGQTYRLGSANGGVSGPALLPVGVLATRRVSERTGLPVIGVGGIRIPADVKQYLEAGASLVAVGTAALADPRCPQHLVAAWERHG
jgi:dihydroorotate dehydrogenase (NAD+) catalytic subunit